MRKGGSDECMLPFREADCLPSRKQRQPKKPAWHLVALDGTWLPLMALGGTWLPLIALGGTWLPLIQT